MNPSLAIIYATIALDAVGLGLVFPILPRLIAGVARTADVAPWIGLMAALYAAMQFIFAPMLGALSDKLGRRPVLLVSMAGAAVNQGIMAVAPNLWLLLAGRALAGLSSANMSVAMAYLTDVSPPDQRARRFGLLNAMFGMGFIVGPVLGGLLGDHGLRLPFIAAAVLYAGNFLLALVALPESRTLSGNPTDTPTDAPSGNNVDLAMLNPLAPLRRVLSMNGLAPLVLLFFILSATGEAYGVCWALWGSDAFHWNGLWIGLSLGAFGVCQTLAQALLPGLASRRLGDRGAALTGIACASIALVAMACAEHGWVVFAIMPLFALGGIGMPALQALATRLVDEGSQGQFQGVLASVVSLASIVAPLGFSSFYFAVHRHWPGAIWLCVVAMNAVAMPLVFIATRQVRPAPPGVAQRLRGVPSA